jgi:plastocyanin
MRRPGLSLLALAVPLSMAAASCGGDDTRTARTATVAAGREARIVAREYSFDPSTLVVTGAGPLRIRLENKGSLAHNLRILRNDTDLGGTATFQGGARLATVSLRPGLYRMVCTVGDHRELGMSGKLRVR